MEYAVLTIVVSFVLMEPFTYAAHRWVMHGFAMSWHRSHHQRWTSGGRTDSDRPVGESWFERNDRFPVVFAAVVMSGFALAFNVAFAAPFVPVGIGATLYGVAYAFVHDVYIHRRLRGFTWRAGWADRLAAAHEVHHRFGAEPYGMLLPYVPTELRARAAKSTSSTSPVA